MKQGSPTIREKNLHKELATSQLINFLISLFIHHNMSWRILNLQDKLLANQ